jgi:hypothetical protein
MLEDLIGDHQLILVVWYVVQKIATHKDHRARRDLRDIEVYPCGSFCSDLLGKRAQIFTISTPKIDHTVKVCSRNFSQDMPHQLGAVFSEPFIHVLSLSM